MSTVNLAKVEARGKLTPRRDPYWQRVEAGCFVGFRKMTGDTPGTWLARRRDPDTGKQAQHPLGEFADLAPGARFDAAVKAARDWFAHLGKGGRKEPLTVKEACANYVQHLTAAGKAQAARDTEKRFERWVDGSKLGGIPLQRLKPSDVDAWRKALAATGAIPQDKASEAPRRARSPSTLNRDMTSLRAALNLALEDGHASSDAAWKTKLRPVKDADGRRDVYLDLTQRRALIAESAPDLAALVRALSLVPLRPGAMAALVVANFDRRLCTLTIGKDKNGQDRKITLPKATAEFFEQQAKGKLPAAPLLSRADGSAWNKDSWKYPLKDAVKAAGLPLNATAYALRHSTITDLIALHKLDTLTVAQLSGTSLQMIEKHYGHLLRDHAARALASLTV
jgi:integrase